jgi:hypothetical protein
VQKFWDEFWKDREGRVVIWQTPNAWLIGWAVSTFISLFLTGRPADVLTWLGEASLIIWALLEIFKGANYFRRLLGLVVLVFAIMSLIKNL